MTRFDEDTPGDLRVEGRAEHVARVLVGRSVRLVLPDALPLAGAADDPPFGWTRESSVKSTPGCLSDW
ncbi:hypothetical protein ACMHYB_09265 [Sorangium sp. So ce1128]